MLAQNQNTIFEVLINDDLINILQGQSLELQGNEYILSILNDFEDGQWRYRKFHNFI